MLLKVVLRSFFALIFGLSICVCCMMIAKLASGDSRIVSAETSSETVRYIKCEGDFVAFAKECNGGNDFAGYTINLRKDLDFGLGKSVDATGAKVTYSCSEYAIKGTFKGKFYGGSHSIKGINLDATSGVTALFSSLKGEVCDLSLEVNFDGQNKSVETTYRISALANTAGTGADVHNCYIKFSISNANNFKQTQYYMLASNAAGSAKFNDLYLEAKGLKPKIYYANSNYSSTNINAKLENVDECNYNVVKFTSNNYWTEYENKQVLKLMLPKTSETTQPSDQTGDGDSNKETDKSNTSEQTDYSGAGDQTSDKTETQISSLTPKLAVSEFTYSGKMPSIEICFEGATEDVGYELSYDTTATKLGEVGDYSATISLVDTSKYNLTTNLVNFKINPYEITIKWDDKTTFEYNGKEQAPNFSFDRIDFAPELSIEYKQKFTDVGEYTAELIAPDNFSISNPTCEMKILPYTLYFTWENTSLTYNADYQFPTVKVAPNDIISDDDLELSGDQKEASSTAYLAVAKLKKENKNIVLDKSATCEYHINPVKITVEWKDKTTFEYNAQNQQLGFSLILPDFAKEDYFYTELCAKPCVDDEILQEAVAVGAYTIRVKTKAEYQTNYYVLNGRADFEITKYQLRVEWDEKRVFEYSGQEWFPEYKINLPDFCDSLKYMEVEKWKNVGKYTAYLYHQSDTIELTNFTCPFEIVKCPITLTWYDTNLTYNGTIQYPKVKCENMDFEDIKLSVSVKDESKNQGNYTATATITSANASNFKITDETASTKFTINPYEFIPQWDTSEIVFDGNPHAPKLLNNLPNFADGVSIVTSISLANNNFENFKITSPDCVFAIVPAKVWVTWENSDLVYNGKIQYPKFTFDKTFANQYDIENAGADAKEYTAKIVSKSTNYEFENAEVSYIIKQYTVALRWENTLLTYNAQAQKPSATYTETEFCKNLDISVSGEQIKAGTYWATATIDEQKFPNFALSNTTQEFTINPKELHVNWLTTSAVFDGTPLGPEFEVSGGFEDVQVNCPSYTACGSYEVILECKNPNYSLDSSTNTFTITAKPIKITWSELEFTFDDEFHIPIAIYEGVKLEVSGAQQSAGEHVATCVGEIENCKIMNDTQKYTIKKRKISVSWVGDKFVYNGKTQDPQALYSLPNFANPADFEVIGGAIKAGNGYVAEVVCHNNNYELENATAIFEIEARAVEIEWGNSSLTYNGVAQMPKFGYSKDDVVGEIEITASGAGQSADTHTVTLTSQDPNFRLTNATIEYQISPYIINIEWDKNSIIYNNSPQKPQFLAQIPQFANDLKIVCSGAGVEVGNYSVTATIDADCANASNFALSNATANFEILPCVLELVWSDVDATFTGEFHIPTANYATDIAFAPLPKITVLGSESRVGNYVATATIDDRNFALSNPECPFSITPQEVEYQCEQAVIQISAPNEQIVDKIDIKDVGEKELSVPVGQSFIFGFEISAVVKSAVTQNGALCATAVTTLFADANSATSNENISGKYLITLSLSESISVPENANLYLYNGETCTLLTYSMEGNTLKFATSELGTVFLSKPQNDLALLPLTISLGSVSALLLVTGVVVAVSLKRRKSNRSANTLTTNSNQTA